MIIQLACLNSDYDGPFKILLLIFPMQTVDKLFTNSTNRTPLLPQPLFRIPSRLACPNIYLSAGEKQQVLCLLAAKKILESQIRQGQKEEQKMMDLFQSILKTQRGQSKPQRKLQRRCNKDILERQYYCKFDNCTKAYSSPTCLQRHAKLKHNSGKTQPPQPYNQLPPNPNLTLEDSRTQT